MKLKETIQKFPQTEIWNDSCDLKELEYAIDYGAVGATTNPSIVLSVLKNNFTELKPRIDEMIQEHPYETEDEIAWRVIGQLGQDGAEKLFDIFQENKGKKGRLSSQVNAKFYKSKDRIVEHALQLNSLVPNGQIKAPTSKAGVEAFEELTYRGVSINATVCFTVSQAIAVADAVERGLKRREAEGLETKTMSPVCTIMAGRVDDYLKGYVDKNNIIVDPEALEYAGVFVGKQVYKIFKERGYRTRLLIAAYRNHYHWSEFIGGDVILTIPYKWQLRYNNSSVEIKDNISKPYDERIMKTLTSLGEFNKAFDENGLTMDDFENYGAFKITMNGFLQSYDELVQIIRECMV